MMPNNDAYLWDRTGDADSDLVLWEERLSAFSSSSDQVRLTLPEAVQQKTWRAPSVRWIAIAASLLLAFIVALRIVWQPGRDWKVTAISGSPVINDKPVEVNGQLSIGELLRTDTRSRAMLRMGLMARIEVGPETQIRFIGSQSGRQRLSLQRGKITARVWAPPFSLFVDTPAATAVDLGCGFTLQVTEQGSGELHVSSGWVESESEGRQAIVPAGAMAFFRPGFGPGTQFFQDAAPGFQATLRILDFTKNGYLDSTAIQLLLSQARPRDAITLLGLIRRVDPSERGAIFDKLRQFVPPPPYLTRDDVIQGTNLHGLDKWWENFGFGKSKSWLFDWNDIVAN